MTESTKYVTISDEQMKNDIASNDDLFIIGKCGSGKTKLVNRILRYLDTQTDCVYLFFSHDLLNHTDDCYGNINATVLPNDTRPFVESGIDNFPATNLALATGGEEVIWRSDFVFMMADKCAQNNKRLYVIADDVASLRPVGIMARRIPSFKLIVTAVVAEDFEDVLDLNRTSQRNFVTIQL